MADDLADRISGGALAVTDLVPDEQRFARLSAYVLRGGASRFAPVVLDDEPIRYVLPVGVPGRQLDFGTLIIQRSQCALVWRTDPARPFQALVTHLGGGTVVMQSAATVQGETWGRFDLHHTGSANVTFLVPPVTTPALPLMLQRVLVTEPGSQVGHFALAPLPAAVTDQAPIAVPAVTAPLPGPLATGPLATGQPVVDEVEAPTITLTPASTSANLPPVLYRASGRVAPRPRDEAAPLPAPTPLPTVATPTPLPLRAPDAAQPGGLSQTVRGFLAGLVPTLVVGALVVLAKSMGMIG